MNRSLWSVEERALRLVLSLAASQDAVISRRTLDDHFLVEAGLLVSLGLLVPEGHATTISADDDVPVAVEWSAERSSFGYFSETDGWVDVAAGDLMTFALHVPSLVTRLVSGLDIQPRDLFRPIVPELLWEMGTCRLPGRSKRVTVWIARRLHDPRVWQTFVQAARDRPTDDIRMVLHVSEDELPNAPYIAQHVIIAAGSVIAATRPFEIAPQIVTARLQNPAFTEGPVQMSADGGHLIVNGKSYTFRGVKHRAIVSLLHEAWLTGRSRRLTEEVLLEAECSASTRRLSRVFKGHTDWHEIIKEEGGVCWLEV
jgi:hypothetical protein